MPGLHGDHPGMQHTRTISYSLVFGFQPMIKTIWVIFKDNQFMQNTHFTK